MKTKALYLKPIAAIFIAQLALSGCGGSRSTDTDGIQTGFLGNGLGTDTNSTPPTFTGTDNSSISEPARSTDAPPISFKVSGVGYNPAEQTISVQANKILKVRFIPGIQQGTVEGTGFAPPYSTLGVYITAGSTTEPTEMLSNGLVGGQAAHSRTIDFSGAFTKTCPKSDSACRQEVEIKVHRPNYDFDCLNYGWLCPWSHVRDGHPWNGSILVETDDTNSLD